MDESGLRPGMASDVWSIGTLIFNGFASNSGPIVCAMTLNKTEMVSFGTNVY